ncbi:MAG: 50S ribosomal protein L23 [Candidatus Micrarchaeota archaeon]|nr:50S ribosomal protein L23 [Candidatus Micrarchaeota archaeon]
MIVKGVVRTEKAVNMASFRKTMAFVVVNTAKKPEIKTAIEKLLGKKIVNVRTQINYKGKKIAYVTFAKDVDVEELAASLNLV